MPDGSHPSAILATYSDWRPVKGRKVLQLTFEVPLERQAEVLSILGAPMPDREVWAGITLIDKGAMSEPERIPPPPSKSEQAKIAYRMKDQMEQAVSRSGLLCKDPQFQRWIMRIRKVDGIGEADPVAAASAQLRGYLGVDTRREIASNDFVYRQFLALEDAFKAEQLMEHQRG
jgi:hypothetical protein